MRHALPLALLLFSGCCIAGCVAGQPQMGERPAPLVPTAGVAPVGPTASADPIPVPAPVVAVAAAPSPAGEPIKVGAAVELPQTEAVTVTQVVAAPDRYTNKPIRVEGQIRDVCQKKGCWLVVADGQQQMRVTFKDYGFFVPKDVRGARVVLQGVVTSETVSEEDARHYASESAEGHPETIHGPQQALTMVADGVEIVR